jgi:hypothetical protein
MADNDTEQGDYTQLLGNLHDDEVQAVTAVIKAAEMDAAAVALAKSKGLSEDTVSKKFTSDIQKKYDELMPKLSAHDQKVFRTAVEEAKMDGSQQPELAQKNIRNK